MPMPASEFVYHSRVSNCTSSLRPSYSQAKTLVGGRVFVVVVDEVSAHRLHLRGMGVQAEPPADDVQLVDALVADLAVAVLLEEPPAVDGQPL